MTSSVKRFGFPEGFLEFFEKSGTLQGLKITKEKLVKMILNF